MRKFLDFVNVKKADLAILKLPQRCIDAFVVETSVLRQLFSFKLGLWGVFTGAPGIRQPVK